MGGDEVRISGGTAGLDRTAAEGVAPNWDRFAHWSKLDARLALLALLLLLFVSALVPVNAGRSTVKTQSFTENVLGGSDGPERPRDDDLQLYDTAIARIQAGENYYDFIVGEHRKADYPVNPAIAVRLPTLAYIDALLREPGQIAAAIFLMFGVLLAWWRRLGEEPGVTGRRRRLALALLFVGASLGLNRYYFVLHELWAGMLIALAFGLHRPGKWGAALAAAALALAIREHVLPFVLLMGAMAFWRRDWKEGAAWTALTLVFLAALAVHLHVISQQVLPSDRLGPGWLELRGLSGWISNVALSSNLRFLPHWLVGPAVILMVLGWAGWRSPAGVFGTFLYLGYGLAFMVAGRGDNFYWGAIIAPAMFIGLVFAPMALKSLFRATRLGRMPIAGRRLTGGAA